MFLIIPTGVKYQTSRYPVITFWLIGLNVAVYLVTLFFFFQDFSRSEENSLEMWFIENFWLIPAESHWYAYLTSMFVHADIWHLGGNMIYLFLFGSCVEDTVGRWKYLLIYFIGGLASTFGHIAVQGGHFSSDIPFGGASGAIYVCMGAFLMLLPRREIDFKWIIFIFFRFWHGDFTLKAWIVMVFWFLKDLLFAILSIGSMDGGTAFGAHAGGFIAGMGLGVLTKMTLPREEPEPAPISDVTAYRPSEPPTIFIFENGSQSGPFTTSQVIRMRTLGSLGSEACYWQEGMTDWQSVHDL